MCPIVFQGTPSNFKVTRDKKSLILTRIERFRIVIQFWIHRWLWNDAQSLTYKKCPFVFQGHPSTFKVTREKKLPTLTRIGCLRTVTPVWIHRWIWNDAQTWCSIEEVTYHFSRSSIKCQGHTGWKSDNLNPIWARLLDRSQLSNPSDLPCWLGAGIWECRLQNIIHFVEPSKC